ncbi:MAG TPA: sigma-70 family RNA polymerase sigma factor [Dehalococcoidia bacterium]|nr:sigma-70 family RNA polymerase sigma factor [Dehalococcoidia bacterium]
MLDEETLVRRAQSRDEQAWGQLYEMYIDKIYSYIRLRVGDPQDAEDIASQVFLKALQSIGFFKWKGIPFSAWLFRIAHNQVIDHMRRAKPRASLAEGVPTPSGENPELMAEQSLDWEAVRRALTELTPAQRQVIELRFAGGLSTAETAKVMGKKEGAIKALQHSALIALRKRLSTGANYG